MTAVPFIPRKELMEEVLRTGDSLRPFSTMVVIGIGGSSLGLRALLSALGPRTRQIILCDDLDPIAFQTVLARVDWEKTVVNIISKSGGTIEIMAMASVVVGRLKTVVGDRWTDHVVVTTDPKEGFLRQWATQNKLRGCQIPPSIGGRFSVFTAVGMLPLHWAGYHVGEIWAGARDALSDTAPQKWAEQHVAWDREGRHIAVIMPYATCLTDYAHWFVQLWAESMGKEGKGQTPMVAVGSGDQHSQLQMFADGPKDKCIRFVTVEKWPQDVIVPTPLDPSADYLKGKPFGRLLSTGAEAIAQALQQVGCPSYTIALPTLSEFALGHLMMGDILMTLAAATLYGVNPYGQPGVEQGKKLWRERLSQC